MVYIYKQDHWREAFDDSPPQNAGWEEDFPRVYGADLQLLEEYYPELHAWGDVEKIWAWGGYCDEVSFVSWEDPYRSESFLLYLRLYQEGKIPEDKETQSTVHDLMDQLLEQ